MSIFDALFGQQAQVPGATQQPSGLQQLFQPQTAMPIAAALLGGQGDAKNFGNAFSAYGQAQAQTAQKNKTMDFFRSQAPEYAQAVEAGLPLDEAWKSYTQQKFAQKAREIRNDSNGVPRYVDSGAAVYPSDQSASAGTPFFSGRSVEAQGLNFLIDSGAVSKEQAANLAAGKTVSGPNGEIIFMTPQGVYQQPAGGGTPTPVQPGGAPAAQNGNIPITGPKYSEDMRKAGGFALRASEADKIVSDPKISAAGASYEQNLKSAAPFGIGNYLVSSDFQKYDQSQRDFVNAVLRRESGAAISESEFQNARKQYFPQPGDGEDVIKQKAQNRKLAVQSLYQSADPVPSNTGAAPLSTQAPGAPNYKSKYGLD